MSEVNRRDAARVVAGLALGTGAFTAVLADQPDEATGVVGAEAKDQTLATAVRNLTGYMFQEEQTVKLNGDGHSRDLIITSARDQDSRSAEVRVRSASMQVFRADADKDEFTQKGGVYWTFNGKQGTVQFKQPGALVVVATT